MENSLSAVLLKNSVTKALKYKAIHYFVAFSKHDQAPIFMMLVCIHNNKFIRVS